MKAYLLGGISIGVLGAAGYFGSNPAPVHVTAELTKPVIMALNPDSLVGVFEGRTPCGAQFVEFAGYAGPSCEKMKWRITLYRNAESGSPSRYEFKGTRVTRTGTWRIERGTAARLDAVVYRLASDVPSGSLAFYRADDNILLLLDSDRRLMVGDAAFSYTLSRIR